MNYTSVILLKWRIDWLALAFLSCNVQYRVNTFCMPYTVVLLSVSLDQLWAFCLLAFNVMKIFAGVSFSGASYLFFVTIIFLIYVDNLPSLNSYASAYLESSMLAVSTLQPQSALFCFIFTSRTIFVSLVDSYQFVGHFY